MRPNSLIVVAVALSTATLDDTSQRMKQASWPAARSSAASALPGASATSHNATRAPSRASRRAQAAPMPLAAPVMTTTRPPRPKEMVLLMERSLESEDWKGVTPARAWTPAGRCPPLYGRSARRSQAGVDGLDCRKGRSSQAIRPAALSAASSSSSASMRSSGSATPNARAPSP